jgi:hypothetical protein
MDENKFGSIAHSIKLEIPHGIILFDSLTWARTVQKFIAIVDEYVSCFSITTTADDISST